MIDLLRGHKQTKEYQRAGESIQLQIDRLSPEDKAALKLRYGTLQIWQLGISDALEIVDFLRDRVRRGV